MKRCHFLMCKISIKLSISKKSYPAKPKQIYKLYLHSFLYCSLKMPRFKTSLFYVLFDHVTTQTSAETNLLYNEYINYYKYFCSWNLKVLYMDLLKRQKYNTRNLKLACYFCCLFWNLDYLRMTYIMLISHTDLSSMCQLIVDTF